MLQIAIIGMAIMLVLKGIDIWHQQKIAESAGHNGSHVFAMIGSAVAILGAIFLVHASIEQAEAVPDFPTVGTQ